MSAGRVLVIDDDPVTVMLLRLSFELEGYEVISADSGPAGLVEAKVRRPDLVVLDVMLPGMGGLDVAEQLRHAEVTAGIPMILLSARAQRADVAAGLALADDYVTKPFEPLDLLRRAADLLASAPTPAERSASGAHRP